LKTYYLLRGVINQTSRLTLCGIAMAVGHSRHILRSTLRLVTQYIYMCVHSSVGFFCF